VQCSEETIILSPDDIVEAAAMTIVEQALAEARDTGQPTPGRRALAQRIRDEARKAEAEGKPQLGELKTISEHRVRTLLDKVKDKQPPDPPTMLTAPTVELPQPTQNPAPAPLHTEQTTLHYTTTDQQKHQTDPVWSGSTGIVITVWLIALSAFIATWGGWVGLGKMTAFGETQLLPGLVDTLTINLAVTLPLGLEAYSALAVIVWLSHNPHSPRTRSFARASAMLSFALGASGQVSYHLLHAAGIEKAPWPIVAAVSCVPVLLIGMGTALLHMYQEDKRKATR
jgi:hypothetical protein